LNEAKRLHLENLRFGGGLAAELSQLTRFNDWLDGQEPCSSMVLYDHISWVAKAPVGAYAICTDAID
jgi:hypothetical protein